MMPYDASRKARSYALTLAGERDIPPAGPYKWEAEVRQILRNIQGEGGFVTAQGCSRVIDWLKTIPKREAPAQVTATRGVIARVRPGCFIMDRRIWVVTERQDQRGVYAKLLVESAERIRDEDGERVNFELTYDRDMSLRALGELTEAHRMDFATARDYMIRYRRCFAPVGRSVCGLRLKAADSVELSIGPVCGPKFPGYDEAVEQLRAGRKHALYEMARTELGIGLSDVELYRVAGPNVSTVRGIERKLDTTPALV